MRAAQVPVIIETKFIKRRRAWIFSLKTSGAESSYRRGGAGQARTSELKATALRA